MGSNTWPTGSMRRLAPPSASSMPRTPPLLSGSIVRRMVKSPTPSFRSILRPSRRSSAASAIRARPRARRPAVDAGLRAVMFTDIVGSTEMTARLGDSAALELVRAHDALVRRGLDAYGGREIKHTGDGIMASFDNVANSVRAAADIQRRFAAYSADASETLSVRIGIDAGEPVEDHNDLFGSRCNWRRGSAAKPRPTASSFPDSRARCARRMRRVSWRSASGDSRASPIKPKCSGLSGGTDDERRSMLSAPPDRRLTPVRADLAAEHLRGLVDAPRYARGRGLRVIAASAPLRRSPSVDAPIETEALYGESVTVYDENGGWAWAQLDRDQYVGYLPIAALGHAAEPTHQVTALRTHAYPGPSVKLPPRMALSLGARVAIVRHDGDFLLTGDGNHLCLRHLSDAGDHEPDFSRSPSAFSRRPICGAGGHRKVSTAPGLSRPPSRRPESLRPATAT